MTRLGIHIFRRDLRLEDNAALNALAQQVDSVLPVFIFDERQVGEHPYRGPHGLQILAECLEDLNQSLLERGGLLHVRRGIAEDVVAELIESFQPAAVSFAADYTPFALQRDARIKDICTAAKVSLLIADDATLHPPGSILTKEGKEYSVYTRYRIAAEAIPVPLPSRLSSIAFASRPGSLDLAAYVKELVPAPAKLRVKGGRTSGKELLRSLATLTKYAQMRDFPAIQGTSLLSAHIKFGTLSMREIYHFARTRLPGPTAYLRELMWHDFFTAVAARAPHVYAGAYRPEFDALEWNDDAEAFARWCSGTTGFPIVDAGMRELRKSGYMHNRVRMITASFLVKDLHISWQWGERHFAQLLTDYDPAVNNGNWQWVAGTGCDASPWFRIFNPWLQQKKFDAEAAYIKRWVPELESCSAADIHDEGAGEIRAASGYPLPMCDHREEALETKRRFGKISQGA